MLHCLRKLTPSSLRIVDTKRNNYVGTRNMRIRGMVILMHVNIFQIVENIRPKNCLC